MAWTEDQLKEAARKAYQAGDTAAAQRLIAEARKVGAEKVPAGMTPEQFAYQKARKAGQMPTPLEAPVTPVSPERAAIEDQIMRMGIISPEQQYKLGQLDDASFAKAIDPGAAGALQSGVGQGLSFGLMDEGAAALRGLFTGDYGKALDEQRLADKVAGYARPKTKLAGEIVGSVMLPGAGGAKVASQGTTLAAKAARGALAGAAAGGAYGFGTGEGGLENRRQSAGANAAIGAGVGAAIPGAGALAKALAQKIADSSAGKAALKLAPSGDELRAMAGRIFDKAENQPLAGIGNDAQSVISSMERGGMSRPDGLIPANAPKALAAANALEDVATRPGGITFGKLDQVRNMAQGAAASPDKFEASLGMRAVEGIDSMFEKAAPGTAKEVAEARAMWGQLRRSEKIEAAIRRAGEHPSGFAQGIQIEFRNILRDPKKLRGFSEQEQKAMRAVTNRLSPTSILAGLGKFSPRLSGNHNVMGSGLNLGLTGTLVNPAAAAVSLGASSLARVLGDRSAMKQADIVRALTAMGSNAPKAGTAKPEAIRKAFEALLLGGALPVTERMQSPATLR